MPGRDGSTWSAVAVASAGSDHVCPVRGAVKWGITPGPRHFERTTRRVWGAVNGLMEGEIMALPGRVVQVLMCRCADIRRLDGEEAQRYAAGHLRLIERGRDPTGAEDYLCEQTRNSWVLDFPLRHWSKGGRGRPRLRRLPLMKDEPPVGALE